MSLENLLLSDLSGFVLCFFTLLTVSKRSELKLFLIYQPLALIKHPVQRKLVPIPLSWSNPGLHTTRNIWVHMTFSLNSSA